MHAGRTQTHAADAPAAVDPGEDGTLRDDRMEERGDTPGEARPADAPPPPAAPARRGCGQRLGRALLALVAVLLLFALWEWLTWPDVAALGRDNPSTTAFMERARRRGDDVEQRWVPYGRISPHLKRAVLVSEDLGFFDHHGFAVGEMKAALEDAWRQRKLPRGASTITQQVAKNLWLAPSYNPLRKVKEAILTRQLEEHLEKRRILEIYLNVAQFGPAVYGAEAAARRYFGKSAADLDEAEAAQLAAGLPRPRTWHPGVDSRGYRWKTDLVRRRMAKAAWLWKVI